MKAPINRIIPFSNVDGPGNRMAIFFQGCNFNCSYCHNPETIHLCCHCGKCVDTCPVQALSMVNKKVVWNKFACIQCDNCLNTCRFSSSPKIEYLDVKELLERIKKAKPFIRGITVSGGECMLYTDYLYELFKEVKKLDLSCLIDSNGSIDFSMHSNLLNVCDGIMLDVKAVDSDFHKQLCKKDNAIVLKNIDYLLSINKLEEVRTVLLPNSNESNLATITYVSQRIKDRCTYKLIRYRPYGVKESNLEFLGKKEFDENEALRLKEIAENNGAIHAIIR